MEKPALLLNLHICSEHRPTVLVFSGCLFNVVPWEWFGEQKKACLNLFFKTQLLYAKLCIHWRRDEEAVDVIHADETTLQNILLCVPKRCLLGAEECHKRTVFALRGALVKWHHIPRLLYDCAEQSSRIMFPMTAYITAYPQPCIIADYRLCELFGSFGFFSVHMKGK